MLRQVSALYENCLKLATENKISSKNTWDLPLIDHISDLVAKDKVALLLHSSADSVHTCSEAQNLRSHGSFDHMHACMWAELQPCSTAADRSGSQGPTVRQHCSICLVCPCA